ncbi:ABC transporter permease [Georgenia thermotolerans]|uniref:FtsX-like permease family protein n=1 Tax=Georgenia thermotolerans TaxID=527326 RepID=A0A7J5UQB6_9MICO|nr:FtsX-like permease family protein [Georgenia thermotolerans]KAE8764608.1 FtsX-like permease family protein [Georgenia thermotolerans]
MLRVALREVRNHLGRFLLSVLAVMLGIAFVTGTFSLRAMLADTFGSIIASTTQGDLYLRGKAPASGQGAGQASGTEENQGGAAGGGGPGGTLTAERTPIPASLADDVAKVDGVRQAVADMLGPAVLIGANGQAVVNGQAPSIGSTLRDHDPSGRLLAGRAPHGPGEIALETTALQTSGLKVGDTTQVLVGNGPLRPVTVVGEVTYGNPMVGTTLVLVDPATGQAAFAPQGLVPQVAIFADPGTDLTALEARVAKVVPGDVEVVTGDEMRAEATKTINQLLGFLGTFLLVFALISLFVGGFIIANTFAMAVRQRQREFALLRAVGASPGQVLTTVLGQAAVVGAVGSAAGIAGGIGLVALLRTWLDAMDMQLASNVVVSPAQAAGIVALGTGMSVLAALVPARRAAGTPPVEAMRDDVVVVERSLRLRAVVGAVLLAGGVAAALVSVQEGTRHAGTWLGVGAGAVLVGTLAVSPVIARAVIGVLAAPFLVLARPMGRLARGNVTRSPRRTASTAGALMIGMALVGACAVLAESAQASTAAIVATESRADFWVQSATRNVPPQVATDVAGLDVVGRADTVTVGRATATGPDGTRSYRVSGLPADAFGRTIRVTVDSGSLAGLARGEVAVQRTSAVEHGWKVGDVLTLPTAAGPREARVGAVVESQLLGTPLVMDAGLFRDVVPTGETTVLAVLVDAKPGVDQATLRAALDRVVKPYVVLTVQDAAELTSALAKQVDQAMVILYALLGLSVVIAVLGIVNTLALAVVERTREIGLMRAVGLGRAQLAATIVLESVLTAVFGTLLGVAVGVSLAAALPTVFADQGLTRLAVPWDLLAVMVVVSGVVGVVAALLPAARATALPVLQAVADE